MQRDIPIPHYTVQDNSHWQDDWELIHDYSYALSPSPLPKHQIVSRKLLKYLSIEIDNKKKECGCEIFSPVTRLKDRNLKFNIYQQSGVKYYLMADPGAKTIKPFELANNSYIEMKNGLQFFLNSSCAVTLLPEQIFET